MASRTTKKQLLAWIQERKPDLVTRDADAELARAFPSASPALRRAAWLESGLPLDPWIEAVRQESFAELARTLSALAALYEASPLPDRRAVRLLVITARDHAQLASRNAKLDAARRAEKQEMAAWMLTWLENPPLFSAWVALRLRAAGGAVSP